jgi:branched-chain amino acid transport system permease protein
MNEDITVTTAEQSFKRVIAAGCIIAAFLAPLATNEYTQYVLNLVVIYALVGVGFNIVVGFLGQLAFANAALFGIGAYSSAILLSRFDLPFGLALVCAGIAGAFAGALVSIPALRGVRSFYLAILTMAFGELMRFVYIHADAITMGSTGLEVSSVSLLTIPLHTQTRLYYAFLPIALILLFASLHLIKSRVGRAICATRDNELAAATLGIPTSSYFVLAFAWSGFIVGIAGAMFAVLIGRVVPESFNLAQLILHFAIVIVGGLGVFLGPIFGAMVLTITPELFRAFPGVDEIVFGSLIVVVLMFRPRGLASLIETISPAFVQRLYRR